MTLQNRCDIHTHTLFSGHAYSTINENVQAAAAAGLELLGSTDHFSAMLFPDYRSGKNYQYLFSVKDWPRAWSGITVLRGVEADIVDPEGNLFGEDILLENRLNGGAYKDGKKPSLYGMVTRNLDYVIASIHGKEFTRDMTQAQNTQMYLNALRQPEVFMLGHIGRTGLDIDIDEIIRVSRDLKKPIEINEHSFHFPDSGIDSRCRKIAERCAELGASVAVSTDAHICCNVGIVSQTLKMLEEIHFPQELIVTKDKETFLHALKEAVGTFRL